MKYKNRVWSFSWNYTNTNEQIKWDFSIMYKMAQSWITSYLSEAFIKISNLKELGSINLCKKFRKDGLSRHMLCIFLFLNLDWGNCEQKKNLIFPKISAWGNLTLWKS